MEPSFAVLCTALVVFTEARSEDLLTQALVAEVVLNRTIKAQAEGLNLDVCAVTNHPNQFTGVNHWDYPRKPERTDAVAWRSALAVSAAIVNLEYTIPPPCSGSLYFHDVTVSPQWGRKLTETCRRGKLIFYK